MAKRPDRTCPITGLPVPYKGFGRPTVYHEAAKQRLKYEYQYSIGELETLAHANAILREANTHPVVLEAWLIRDRARKAYKAPAKTGIKRRPYKRRAKRAKR